VTRLMMLDEIEAAAYADGANGRFSSGRFRDNRDPATRGKVLGVAGGCWCGEPSGHPWPGKADGAPHPRSPRR
jgi:hypothetical protein